LARAWYLLGLVYKKQGKAAEVKTVYEKLKTLDPKLADQLFQKAIK
jgi:hypothetical protein